jgi:hypothetical protein
MDIEKADRRETLVIPGLLALMAVLTAIVILLPGRDGMEYRASFLFMPWGAVGMGFGLIWLTRNPHLENVVGKAFIGGALLLLVGLGVALALQ